MWTLASAPLLSMALVLPDAAAAAAWPAEPPALAHAAGHSTIVSTVDDPVDGITTTDEIELRTTFSVPTNTTARDQYIPMPAGLTPTMVSGTLLADAEVDGRVIFLSHGRPIATFPVSADTDVLEVEFPVSDADVDANGYLVFAMRFLTESVSDEALICIISNFGTVQFSEITVSVTGIELPPTTIAQFFSPSVREISVLIPDDPQPELQEAGIAAVGALAHRYPTQETIITLSTPSSTTRAADVAAHGGRVIELIPGSGEVVAKVSLRDEVRLLTLTGAPELLTAAANALGSPNLAVIESAETTALAQSGSIAPTAELTLAQLGTETVKLIGIGTSVVEVPVNQTDFGSPVTSFMLHIVGVRSEVPANIAAMLSLYWNGDLVSSDVFDEATAIDLSIEIPSTRVERNNILSFRMDALPSGGTSTSSDTSGEPGGFDCGGPLGILPIEVFIDGSASTVTATPGQGLSAGFVRFPQMLGNILPVAIGDHARHTDSIADAALLVAALQRASAHQFSVRLIAVEDFIDSSMSGLLVGASSADIDALRAPLRMAEFRQIASGDSEFTAGVRAPYAALQAFTSGGREVLSLSSWGPGTEGAAEGRALQTTVAEFIAGEASGWYGLYADLLIAQRADRDPIFLDSRTIALQPERAKDFNTTLLWVTIGVATLVLLGLLGLLARRHTRRRARRFAAAEANWQAARPGFAFDRGDRSPN